MGNYTDDRQIFKLKGSGRQFSRFWDAVHYFSNYDSSRVSAVESSWGVVNEHYVRVVKKDLILFKSFAKAAGIQYERQYRAKDTILDFSGQMLDKVREL